jgi:predicted nucleic acid-binding protein
VAIYFFDSSAIVKRYVSERGTAWVTTVADPAAGNRIYVARVSGAEVISAVTRHARAGAISPAELATALADFRHDFANQYRIVPVNVAVVDRAMNLAEVHGLRGYDAVQLGAALEANAQRVSRGVPPVTLVSSDAELNAAAIVEGLVVDDPNGHP